MNHRPLLLEKGGGFLFFRTTLASYIGGINMKKMLTMLWPVCLFLVSVAASTLAANLPASPATGGKGFITGIISDDGGSPVAGAKAEVFSCDNETLAGFARTDNKGEYTIGPMGAGCYHVRFEGEGYESTWYREQGFRDSAVDVAVTDGKVEGIDGSISAATSAITGTVQSQDGKPLSGAWVTAIMQTDKMASVSDGRTDGKGHYKIQAAAGRYFVVFMRKGYVTKVHGESLDKPTPVDAVEGKTKPGIDAQMVKGGRITGAVTDESGKPLEGLHVFAQAIGAKVLPIVARTAASGEFALDGVPTGRYLVGFGDRGQKFQLQWYDGKADAEEATAVTVTAPKTTSGISSVLKIAGGISGRVTGADGNALAGVMVSAHPSVGMGFGGAAITDGTGTYSIPGLRSGSYKVSFQPHEGSYLPRVYRDASEEGGAVPVEVVAPNVTDGVDQVLPSGTLLTGIVHGSAGEPVRGVSVAIYRASSSETEKQMVGFSMTSPDGTFSLPMQEGEYLLQFNSYEGGYLQQWYDGSTTQKDAKPVVISKEHGTKKLDVVLARGGSISGVVKNPGGIGVAGVRVYAVESATGEKSQWAISSETGFYIINGLASGKFRVTADGATVGYTQTKLPQLVDVTAPRVTENINLIVTPGGAITGRVSDRAGNPLQRINVSVHDPDTWDEVGSSYSDENGSYAVRGLSEGRYSVRFDGTASKFPVQWFKGKARREESAPVEVKGTSTLSGIDAVLIPGVPLVGSVTDAKGAPLADAEVEVYGDIEDEPFDKTRTDSSGKFSIPSLAVGSYRVRFSHSDHVPQWYGGRDRRTAAALAVKEGGGTLSISLVKAEGKISGKLTNPEGIKIGQAWETVIDGNTGVAVADERICECSGQFHTPVLPGVYVIRIERHGLVTWYGGNTREEAFPLTVQGDVEGIDMVIEDRKVRQKQPLPGGVQKP
jgi:5-hydroxyisourate hydrolase-like protein (transthyretin family)